MVSMCIDLRFDTSLTGLDLWFQCFDLDLTGFPVYFIVSNGGIGYVQVETQIESKRRAIDLATRGRRPFC